ncbi:hypothetical protein SMC26_20175 [Actinomadura fulvescens]
MTRFPRLRSAWATAHARAEGVPDWAWIAALAVPLTVLPSSIWRIAIVTFHLPIGEGAEGDDGLPSWLPDEVYAVLLSLFSELVAFTAVGLVATWGEVFPRWIPGLRGRRVPPLAAVIPAALGALVLTLMWTWTAITVPLGINVRGEPTKGDNPLSLDKTEGVIAAIAYAPLLLWGPLLAAVTIAYHHRRREMSHRVPAT